MQRVARRNKRIIAITKTPMERKENSEKFGDGGTFEVGRGPGNCEMGGCVTHWSSQIHRRTVFAQHWLSSSHLAAMMAMRSKLSHTASSLLPRLLCVIICQHHTGNPYPNNWRASPLPPSCLTCAPRQHHCHARRKHS